MPNTPSEPKGLQRAFIWLKAVARVMGFAPRASAPRMVSCPHCGQESPIHLRQCSHCGGVVVPQSKWDTAHAPLEPRRWREAPPPSPSDKS